MSASYTRTAAATTTVAKIAYITRKMQADFLAILDTYTYDGYSESYALEIVEDIRKLLDEEVLDTISFVWTRKLSNRVLDTFRYSVVTGEAVTTNDRSGGVAYHSELALADFRVRLNYNQRWKSMSQSERDLISEDLNITWVSANQLNYGTGSWTTDKTYSKDGYGVIRERFTR
jgi:Bacterial HORMA domain family 1